MASTPSHVGDLIRRWRRLRGFSQAALAKRTGVSVRHLSFIETGRSSPSREMLDWLSQALTVPVDEYHTLLEAAGFFAGYDRRIEEDPRTQEVLEQVQQILDASPTRPSVIHDVYGTLVAWNHAFEELLRDKVPLDQCLGVHGGHQLVALLRAHLSDWENLASLYIRRVYDEMMRSSGKVAEDLQALLDSLLSQAPDAKVAEQALNRLAATPLMIDLTFVPDGEGREMAFRAFTATLGTPATAHLRALRMLTFVPRDAATEARMQVFAT